MMSVMFILSRAASCERCKQGIPYYTCLCPCETCGKRRWVVGHSNPCACMGLPVPKKRKT